MNYQVFIDDNFHYMDESERIIGKTYSTAGKAVAAAQLIVDDSCKFSAWDYAKSRCPSICIETADRICGS